MSKMSGEVSSCEA